MPRNPFETQSPDDVLKARAEAGAAVVRAYGQFSVSPEGKLILADLKARFGYDKMSAKHGMRSEDVFLNEGMKAPIAYVEHMIALFTKREQVVNPRKAGQKRKQPLAVVPLPKPE